jgi:hypothetical protein
MQANRRKIYEPLPEPKVKKDKKPEPIPDKPKEADQNGGKE